MNKSVEQSVLYSSLDYIVRPQKNHYGEKSTNPEGSVIIGAFSKLGYSNLVNTILELSKKEESLDLDTLLLYALNGYMESGNIAEALRLYRKYYERSSEETLYSLSKIASNPEYEIFLPELASLICADGQINIGIWKILTSLWKTGRHDAVSHIQKILSEPLQKLVIMITGLHTKKRILPAQEVSDIILNIPGITNRSMYGSLEDAIIDTIYELGYPISELAEVLTLFKGQHRRSIGSHEIQRKIINYYNERGAFDEAKKLGGEYLGGTLVAKYNYAIKTKNQQLHSECLAEYLKSTEEDLADLEQKIKDAPQSKSEDDDYRFWSLDRDTSWRFPYEILSIHAKRYGEMAIYELLYGSEEKGKEYISMMIESVESIMIRIPTGATERQRGHIKGRIKNPLKRSLKEEFVYAEVFHHLPNIYGWDVPILDSKVREENSIVRRKHREISWNQREAEEQKKYLGYQLETIQKIRNLLKNNNKKELEKFLQIDEDRYHHAPLGRLWDIGILIIEQYPDLYNQTLRALGGYSSDHSNFIPFFIRGYELGCISREDWNFFIKHYYWGGSESINYKVNSIISPIIQGLLNIGKITDAWEFYMSLQSYIRNSSEILKAFLLATGNPYNPNPINVAFVGADSEQLERETAAYKQSYWRTRADISSIFSDEVMYQEATSIERENLISNTDASVGSKTRDYLLSVIDNPLRTPHQIKDEILWILSSPLGKDEKSRRRAAYHLIQKGIPGAEALGDIKKRSNPDRIQRFFFQKLIEKKYISENTKYLLIGSWKENIVFLRRLLAQHQNDFNTVVDILVQKNAGNQSAYGMSQLGESDVGIGKSEWEGVFTTLRIIGVITPGIWKQAISINFDEEKLAELSEKIKQVKKTLFKNSPISDEIHPSLQAEIIYQAYRPMNMDYQRVLDMVGKIPDCSGHLDGYLIPEGGYEMSIGSSQELVMRNDVVADRTVDSFFHKSIRLPSPNLSEIQKMARILTDIGRFKVDTLNEEDFLVIFGILFSEDIKKQIFPLDSDGYKNLRAYDDFLGLFIHDNLENRISEFFEFHNKHTSKILSSFLESLKTEKRKRTLETQLGITIPEVIDNGFSIHIITKIFLEKVKMLSNMRRSLGREIKKYVNKDGSEIVDKNLKLRAYISKNKASFFAKASAGLCTYDDIELFKRKDHFHINIVDEEKQECVGNIMGYNINYKGRRILLLRGFNPNTALMKEIEIASFCESALNIAREFASNNGFDAIYITENAGFLYALSNRGEVVQYMMKKYGVSTGEDLTFKVSSNYTINKIYPIPKGTKNDPIVSSIPPSKTRIELVQA